jgi:hypothetical protein
VSAPAVSIAQVDALLDRARNIRATLGSLGDAAPSVTASAERPQETSTIEPEAEAEPEPESEPEMEVERGRVDKGGANPNVMMLEGLSPGSKLED